MYKCKDFFKSVNGKHYSRGMLITFNEYYQLTDKERGYFVFQQDQNIFQKNDDRIR
jgi:hypothetical protein